MGVLAAPSEDFTVACILFNRSGHRRCQAWCRPKQLGHFAVVVSPALCLFRQMSVVCLPAQIPQRKSVEHWFLWCPKR